MIRKIELTLTVNDGKMIELLEAMIKLKWPTAEFKYLGGGDTNFTPYGTIGADEEIEAMMDWQNVYRYAKTFLVYCESD